VVHKVTKRELWTVIKEGSDEVRAVRRRPDKDGRIEHLPGGVWRLRPPSRTVRSLRPLL